MLYILKLNIAGVIFEIKSRFPRMFRDGESYLPRYEAFTYHGTKKTDIHVNVDVIKRFPALTGKQVFHVHEPASGFERWRLLCDKDIYTYYCPMKERRIMAKVDKTFTRVQAYLLAEKSLYAWDARDLIYDMLHIVLVNYFALNRNGLILHAAGIKENDTSMIFAGKSGNGKSTSAYLWHKHTGATILNDDRILIRKIKNRFYAFSGPWHGEFGHKKRAVNDGAPISGLFIIEHAKKNFAARLDNLNAFTALYPQVFTVFWDKELAANIVALCEDIINNVHIFRLGFTKNKRVIEFVRKEVDKAKKL